MEISYEFSAVLFILCDPDMLEIEQDHLSGVFWNSQLRHFQCFFPDNMVFVFHISIQFFFTALIAFQNPAYDQGFFVSVFLPVKKLVSGFFGKYIRPDQYFVQKSSYECGRYKKFENQKWIILTGLYMDILHKMILLNLCKS